MRLFCQNLKTRVVSSRERTKRMLYNAVFEGVERNDRYAATRTQDTHHASKGSLEGLKFPIDRNAQCLEGPRRTMNASISIRRRHRTLNDTHELLRCSEH